MACVDTAPCTGEYKLLQLRQCLSGEALKVIESLGYSTAAYEAANERLERRYGGKRRQVAIYLEDFDKFSQIRPGNPQDLEQFADLMEIAIINLKETGYHNDNTCSQSAQASPTCNNQRTFFREMMERYSINNTACQICSRDHKIWTCAKFVEKSVSQRWDTAKRFKLCFRCLGGEHRGKSCQRSQPCGQNECQKSDHMLLHRNDNQQVEVKSKSCLLNRSFHTKTCHSRPDASFLNTNKLNQCTSVTDGNDQTKESRM